MSSGIGSSVQLVLTTISPVFKLKNLWVYVPSWPKIYSSRLAWLYVICYFQVLMHLYICTQRYLTQDFVINLLFPTYQFSKRVILTIFWDQIQPKEYVLYQSYFHSVWHSTSGTCSSLDDMLTLDLCFSMSHLSNSNSLSANMV